MSTQKLEIATPNVSEEQSKSIVDIYSDRTIYSLPTHPPDDIVDLVLRLMDGDGPRPMKNLRPVKKTRTGADQFYVDHHGEYEARGQPSRDKIRRVHTHNSAYPKMYDELNRRRSTAQPEAYSNNQNLATPAMFDPNCRICVKLKKQTDCDRRRRRGNRRSRRHRSYGARSNLRETRNKITKSKKQKRNYRCPSRIFKLSKIRTNKGCQCTSYYLPTEKRSACTFNDNNFESVPPQGPAATVAPPSPVRPGNTNENYKSTHVIAPPKKSKKGSKKASKSDIDSGNPETNYTAPSISSYNSFMSMEHEPMVE